MLRKSHVVAMILYLLVFSASLAQTLSVPEMERAVLREIGTKGVGDRLVLDPKPVGGMGAMIISTAKGQISFRDCPAPFFPATVPPQSPISVTIASPEEILPKDNPAAQEVLRVYLRGKVGLVTEFREDVLERDFTGSCVAPARDGAIHRFMGRVRIGPYVFESQGDQRNRLTFALIKDIGYVYIRGMGRVILPDGAERVFGK